MDDFAERLAAEHKRMFLSLVGSPGGRASAQFSEEESQRAHAALAVLRAHAFDRDIVDFVATLFLDIWIESKKARTELFWNRDALRYALYAAQCGASPVTIGCVLREITHVGWHDRAVETARTFLGRALYPVEVEALADAYCRDTASQSGHEERALKELARKCGDAATAQRVFDKLAAFDRQFRANDGY